MIILMGGFACSGLIPTQAAGPEAAPSSPAATQAISFSTYLGGIKEDTIRDIDVAADGSIYVTGGTKSANFPTTPGTYSTNHSGDMDAFVTKFGPGGNLIWSTLVGGPNYDRAYAIEVDSQGYVYIGGRAGDGFPTTAGVIQPNFGGDSNPNSLYGLQDGFVAKLSPNGAQLIWSTYFGGNDRSFIRDFDINSSGEVYLAETEVSTPNPHITPGAFQTSLQGGSDGVVAKLSSNGAQAVWATYLGGSGQHDLGTPSIRVDSSGNAYVLGGTSSTNMPTTAGAYDRSFNGVYDLHLSKFSPNGAYIFGTFVGGADTEFSETHGLALDPQNNPVVAATTKSTNLATTQGAFQRNYAGSGTASRGGNTNYSGDGFVMKFSANGTQLLASTYLGGRYGEGIEGVSVDSQGSIYVSGATYSDNFPTTAGAYQNNNAGDADFFVVKFSANLSQELFSSFLGGGSTDDGRSSAVDSSANIIIVGHTDSANWPTQNAYQSSPGGATDGSLTKFAINAPNQAPTVNAGPDRNATWGLGIYLDGTVNDDGLPIPPGILTNQWSKASGPGVVAFTNPTAADTGASFSQTGVYVLRLTTSDGQYTAFDEVMVTVTVAPGGIRKVYLPCTRRSGQNSASLYLHIF